MITIEYQKENKRLRVKNVNDGDELSCTYYPFDNGMTKEDTLSMLRELEVLIPDRVFLMGDLRPD